jgi:hypothetical protein
MTLFRSARTAAQHLYARYAPDADRTHSPRDKAVAASATDGGVSAEATPIADFTNDVSSTYAQLSSGPAQFSSAPAQLSSGDTQLSSGDDDFISQYVSRLSKEKQGELVEVAKP